MGHYDEAVVPLVERAASNVSMDDAASVAQRFKIQYSTLYCLFRIHPDGSPLGTDCCIGVREYGRVRGGRYPGHSYLSSLAPATSGTLYMTVKRSNAAARRRFDE